MLAWYVNHCTADGMETWDVHFGEPGSGFETIECQSEKDALEVAEVLNRVKAGPDTNSDTRQPWQDVMLTSRGPSNQDNEEESTHP